MLLYDDPNATEFQDEELIWREIYGGDDSDSDLEDLEGRRGRRPASRVRRPGDARTPREPREKKDRVKKEKSAGDKGDKGVTKIAYVSDKHGEFVTAVKRVRIVDLNALEYVRLPKLEKDVPKVQIIQPYQPPVQAPGCIVLTVRGVVCALSVSVSVCVDPPWSRVMPMDGCCLCRYPTC
jgi:hypothetical protein